MISGYINGSHLVISDKVLENVHLEGKGDEQLGKETWNNGK